MGIRIMKTDIEPNVSLEFSHLDIKGRAVMVDVTEKQVTKREAMASARVFMTMETLDRLLNDAVPKGDVLAVARVAGIMAAKKVADLIPLCHPLPLQSVEVSFKPFGRSFENVNSSQCGVEISAIAKTTAVTGVEMEAMTAVSIAALTIYDMCKALEKGITISDVCLQYKTGGKSGNWRRHVSGGSNG